MRSPRLIQFFCVLRPGVRVMRSAPFGKVMVGADERKLGDFATRERLRAGGLSSLSASRFFLELPVLGEDSGLDSWPVIDRRIASWSSRSSSESWDLLSSWVTFEDDILWWSRTGCLLNAELEKRTRPQCCSGFRTTSTGYLLSGRSLAHFPHRVRCGCNDV